MGAALKHAVMTAWHAKCNVWCHFNALHGPCQTGVRAYSCSHPCCWRLCLQDKTVRLWDLRTNICQGLLNTPGNPTAAIDQQVRCTGLAI